MIPNAKYSESCPANRIISSVSSRMKVDLNLAESVQAHHPSSGWHIRMEFIQPWGMLCLIPLPLPRAVFLPLIGHWRSHPRDILRAKIHATFKFRMPTSAWEDVLLPDQYRNNEISSTWLFHVPLSPARRSPSGYLLQFVLSLQPAWTDLSVII